MNSVYWSVGAGAVPAASVCELPHGTLISATRFTSLVAQPRHPFAGTEKVQFEVHLLSGGAMQIGWCAPLASGSFSENDGVGDLPLSVAIDGVRGMLWNVKSQPLPSLRWGPGAVVSCYADLLTGHMEFALNGSPVTSVQLPTGGTQKSSTGEILRSSHTRRRASSLDTIMYAPALSLEAHEACVVNIGEVSLRYPKPGYHSLCDHDAFCSSGGRRPTVTPVPLGATNVGELVVRLNYSQMNLVVPRELAEESNVEDFALRAADALEYLGGVLNRCVEDIFEPLMSLVNWLQERVTERWRAFVLTLYFWFSSLYVVENRQSSTKRRLVDSNVSTTERIKGVLLILETLLPPQQLHVLPSCLLSVFQHRLADHSRARALTDSITFDLISVPWFRYYWVREGPLFTSTLLNLFQLHPVSQHNAKWLAEELETKDMLQILSDSAMKPSRMCKSDLTHHTQAVRCVELLFSDPTCQAPLTVTLTSLMGDASLLSDRITSTLEDRLGGYRATFPLTYAMPSPAAVLGLLSWAVVAALSSLMKSDTTQLESAAKEPCTLAGLQFRLLALKWLPPQTFYGPSATLVLSPQVSRIRSGALARQAPDVRVGGTVVSVQAQLQAESVKPLRSSSATHQPNTPHPATPSSRVNRRVSTYDRSDPASATSDDEDDEGPALGSAGASFRSLPAMSTVRRQRANTAATSSASCARDSRTSSAIGSTSADGTRWEELPWRRKNAQFSTQLKAYALATGGLGNSATRINDTAPLSSDLLALSQGGRASSSSRAARPSELEEAAAQTDLYRTAIIFVHTFTRHPSALFGSLELLLSLAEQYTSCVAMSRAASQPAQKPKSASSESSSSTSGRSSWAHSSTEASVVSAGRLRRASATVRHGGGVASQGDARRDDAVRQPQAVVDALQEVCTVLRRVEFARNWGVMAAACEYFVTGTWMMMTYYWSRMNLFERRLTMDSSAHAPGSSPWPMREDEEALQSPPRAFLMLPIEMVALCAELSVYTVALGHRQASSPPREMPAALLILWDAQLRRAVSHSTTRSLLYRATASLFSSSTQGRQSFVKALQSQKQAHEAYLEALTPLQREVEDPLSLYEGTFLDSLDAYTSEENFNETSTLTLLFSFSQESCLLPPPRLFEENLWWVAALRHVGKSTSATSTVTQMGPGEADALNLHGAVSAMLKFDSALPSALACISKCNQVLTQFGELLPVKPASLRTREEVRSFHTKYVLLRKNLYVLDFLVKVLSTAELLAPRVGNESATRQNHLDSVRVSLMDLLTQCVVRLAFNVPSGANAHVEQSISSRVSSISYWSTTTNGMTASIVSPSTRSTSAANSVMASQYGSNVLQPGLCRDAEGWWTCAGSACTVTGLLAPVWSLLNYIITSHGKDVTKNAFFRVCTSREVLICRSLELLQNQSWWGAPTSTSASLFQEEHLSKKSQSILGSLQDNLRQMAQEFEVEKRVRKSTRADHVVETHSATAAAGSAADTGCDNICLICEEVAVDTVFEPCGHTCCHLCYSRYQNTLTVKAASSAKRSAPSSREMRGTAATAPLSTSSAKTSDEEQLTMSRFSSSRRSRGVLEPCAEKCFFCQQTIQSTAPLPKRCEVPSRT